MVGYTTRLLSSDWTGSAFTVTSISGVVPWELDWDKQEYATRINIRRELKEKDGSQ